MTNIQALRKLSEEEVQLRLRIFINRRERIRGALEQLSMIIGKDQETIKLLIRLGKLKSIYNGRINQLRQSIGDLVNPKVIKKKTPFTLKEGKIYKIGKSKVIKELDIADLPKYMSHRRMRTFIMKGLACVHPGCTKVGTRLIMTTREGRCHLDVYTDDYHLMTNDHIMPKSKGGSNDLSNLQPMCKKHNNIKGDTWY